MQLRSNRHHFLLKNNHFTQNTKTDTIFNGGIAHTILSPKSLTAQLKMFITFDALNEMLRNFVQMLQIEHYLRLQICRTIEIKL